MMTAKGAEEPVDVFVSLCIGPGLDVVYFKNDVTDAFLFGLTVKVERSNCIFLRGVAS